MKNLRISKYLYFLLLIACFFPFISFLGFQTDSQPNAIIFSALILFLKPKTLFPKPVVVLMLLSLFGLFVLVISKFETQNLISVIGYFSLFIVPFTVFLGLKYFDGLSFRLFKIVSIIWGMVALIQKFIYPSFLTFLLPRASGITINGRGVISLAPEPTYYGTVTAILIVIYLLNFWNKEKSILYFLIFQLVFLSISSTIIFIAFFSFILYFVVGFFKIKLLSKVYLLSIVFVITTLGFILKDHWQETRVFKTIDIFVENPELLLKDESISERVNHIYFSVTSLQDNYGLPYGYGNFQDYIIKKSRNAKYNVFFQEIDMDHYAKIMSGYGTIIFEFGVLGLLLPFLLFWLMRKTLKYPHMLFAYIFINLILLTAISLFNALVLFVIGNLIFLHKKDFYFENMIEKEN